MKLSTPILIGVAEVKNKSTKIEDAREPLDLIFEAAELALKDARLPSPAEAALRSSIDSISVVRPWTWPYPDLPTLIAKQLDVKPRYSFCSEHGGNQPAKLLDEAARRVSQGGAKVALVTGGEALASLSACVKKGKMPPPGWTNISKEGGIARTLTLEGKGDTYGARHSIGLPIHVYPLYENAFRAYRSQSMRENHEESASLYAEFARIAAENPYAWNYEAEPATKEQIATVSERNRMICHPYPLLMNAFNAVNLAAACMITSVGYARQLGIPEDRWVYVLGGAGMSESEHFWERQDFYSSSAMEKSLSAALQISGIALDDIDVLDLYSCFPIVPKLACRYLRIDIERPRCPISLLGGLTSFGGAGNNYSMHAITAMVRHIRARKARNGLVLANGGCLTYQHVICLSSDPRKSGPVYPEANPLPTLWPGVPEDLITQVANGPAYIVTYTVEFDRLGRPSLGYVIGHSEKDGRRFIANHGDDRTLRQLASMTEEQISREGWVRHDQETGRNLFSLDKAPSI